MPAHSLHCSAPRVGRADPATQDLVRASPPGQPDPSIRRAARAPPTWQAQPPAGRHRHTRLRWSSFLLYACFLSPCSVAFSRNPIATGEKESIFDLVTKPSDNLPLTNASICFLIMYSLSCPPDANKRVLQKVSFV